MLLERERHKVRYTAKVNARQVDTLRAVTPQEDEQGEECLYIADQLDPF